MNDFTKEELLLLRTHVCIGEGMFGHTEERKSLREKLNFMIDNYQIHKQKNESGFVDKVYNASRGWD